MTSLACLHTLNKYSIIRIFLTDRKRTVDILVYCGDKNIGAAVAQEVEGGRLA